MVERRCTVCRFSYYSPRKTTDGCRSRRFFPLILRSIIAHPYKIVNMNPNKSRREFVKNTGMLAGGLLVLPTLSRANFFSGADDTIKIALVGCGGRGTGAITQALSTKQNVKLVAMADAFRDRLDNCYTRLTTPQ